MKLFGFVAVIAALLGSAGSLVFTFYEGRNSDSIVLPLLFAGWVVSPFIGLLLINVVSSRWSASTRKVIYSLMLIAALVSFILYSRVWSSFNVTPAFIFFVTPLISWVVIGVSVTAARLFSTGNN